ncbi:hypothetical protein [Marinobacter sp. NSM]|uniref:hypothetical protein n=1 Tax=Marinobacter sp. NSM TaxID=3458004 RepID=UPI004035DB5F
MSKIFSSAAARTEISKALIGYLKLPFSGDSVPGTLLENVIGSVRGATVLNTYDFVDVISAADKVGWQIKSTKDTTPVTWKRAKIAGSARLIEESRKSVDALQDLGNRIIRFCNEHAEHSIQKYALDEIGFSRLVVHSDGRITYYERLLCTADDPRVFFEDDFTWHWSTPKKTKKGSKEQLPALHGTHVKTGKKWFAWHGLGENQLHFSGESEWWPKATDDHHVVFRFPETRLSQDELMQLLKDAS